MNGLTATELCIELERCKPTLRRAIQRYGIKPISGTGGVGNTTDPLRYNLADFIHLPEFAPKCYGRRARVTKYAARRESQEALAEVVPHLADRLTLFEPTREVLAS